MLKINSNILADCSAAYQIFPYKGKLKALSYHTENILHQPEILESTIRVSLCHKLTPTAPRFSPFADGLDSFPQLRYFHHRVLCLKITGGWLGQALPSTTFTACCYTGALHFLREYGFHYHHAGNAGPDIATVPR